MNKKPRTWWIHKKVRIVLTDKEMDEVVNKTAKLKIDGKDTKKSNYIKVKEVLDK